MNNNSREAYHSEEFLSITQKAQEIEELGRGYSRRRKTKIDDRLVVKEKI